MRCYNCQRYGHLAKDCKSGSELLMKIVRRGATSVVRQGTLLVTVLRNLQVGTVTGMWSVTGVTRRVISPETVLVTLSLFRQR